MPFWNGTTAINSNSVATNCKKLPCTCSQPKLRRKEPLSAASGLSEMLAATLTLDRKFCAVLSTLMARATAAAITKSVERDRVHRQF
jgi:hypothetical protein